MQHYSRRQTWVYVAGGLFLWCWATPSWAWDSYGGNPKSPTHTRFTEWALEELRHEFPDLYAHRKSLIEGCNAEMHLGTLYVGEEFGSERPRDWWVAAQDAWRVGNDEGYYLYLGALLHLVQDMGVPAYAHKLPHCAPFSDPGNPDAKYDPFELLAYGHWDPDLRSLNRTDPGYEEPWQYYDLNREWTLADTPDYKADACPKAWSVAAEEYRWLVRARQARTCAATKWALRCSALKRVPRFDPAHQDADTAVLSVRVTTAADKDAGTDDLVFFSLGEREWWLNIPHRNDFEPGQTDTFVLAPANRSEVREIVLRKGKDVTGPWKVASLVVRLGEQVIYQKDSLGIVLKNGASEWRAERLKP
jgi:hypothetical protein